MRAGRPSLPRQMLPAGRQRLLLDRRRVAIKLPKIDIYQYWHQRFHRDPANQWIRSIFKSLFSKSSATMDAR
jgi:hypothetical protein